MANKKKTKRREESKRIEEVVSNDTNLVDKLFIAGGVLLFILAFYGLTLYITGKNSDEVKEEKKEVEISREEIIVGRSLSMSKDDYYVLYYDDTNSTTYDEMIKKYTKSISLYKVNMSNGFNKKYVTDGESNKSPSKVSEFKINGPTLIKVSKNKVIEYVEGEEAIRTILN
jgi:hypothetical protein